MPVGIHRVWVLSVLFAGSVLYSGSSPAQELRRIHYGTTASTAHLPIWVAKDAGFFAKQGLNVEPVHIRGGALITMGIMSGQLQFSGAGAESISGRAHRRGRCCLARLPGGLRSGLFHHPAGDKIRRRVERQSHRGHPPGLDDSFLYARRRPSCRPRPGKGHDDIATGHRQRNRVGAGERPHRRRGDHPSLCLAILAKRLAAARRPEHHRSGLSVILCCE